MTYTDAISYLNSFLNFERLPDSGFRTDQNDLRRFKDLLTLLGSPQDDYPLIHIVGTKGKGSTAAMLEAVLRKAGLKTGLYTSPHLISVRERIRLNGRMISKRAFASIISTIKGTPAQTRLGKKVAFRTVFEHLTAAALATFSSEKVDVAIIEAGLGAKLDATIVLEPIVSVVTKISLDHTAILGESVEEIAEDKSQAIRKYGETISSPQSLTVEKILMSRAEKVNARLRFSGGINEFNHIRLSSDGTAFRSKQSWLRGKDIKLNLCGEFQLENLSTALVVLDFLRRKGFNINSASVGEGLKHVKWFGRMHITGSDKKVIIDGAHNEIAVEQVCKTIKKLFPERNVNLLFATMKNKRVEEMLRMVLPICSNVYLCPLRFPKSFSPLAMKGVVSGYPVNARYLKNIPEAFDVANAECNSNSVLLVTGSLYLAGEVMRHIRNMDPPPDDGSIDCNC